jgi:tryptophan halogenase
MRLVIVGGGSAGWIVASYLNAALNDGARPAAAITVIESPATGRIGVGEATVPSIRQTLSRIGIDEIDFMKAADATFKNAIFFENWRSAAPRRYFHPFDRRAASPGDRVGEAWRASARNIPWTDYVSALARLSNDGRAPKAHGWPSFGSTFPYAYHMDAEKFADYLAVWSTKRGVAHVRDDVVAVDRAEDGSVRRLSLKSGAEIAGDIYVDCTGFAAILIEKALGVPWVDFSPWLLCDRAIAMRVPHESHYPGRIKPFTTATALSAGWAWDIGLLNRRGRGYVYSSAFIDDDAAEAELRAFEGPHAAGLDARRLRFRVGRRREFWSHNVIGIGLSSGFIEPLESTALYTVEFAAAALADLAPSPGAIDAPRKRYNEANAALFDEILDFINLHYVLSDRSDTAFWRAATKPERRTAFIESRLELWRAKAPSALDFDMALRLFSPQSYEYVLYGMTSGDGPGAPLSMPEALGKILAASREKFPSHEDWLRRNLGAAI